MKKLCTQASVGKAESKTASRPSSSSSTSHLGVMVPGSPAKCEETEDENATALALRENVVFAKKVWEEYRRRCRSLSEQVGQRIILLESLSDKQSSFSFSRDNKRAMYELLKLRKHRQKNQIMMLRRTHLG